MEGILVDTNMIVQETVKGAEIGRETIGEIGTGTMIILKRKAGIEIDIRIVIMVMTEEVAVSTRRVTGVTTKKVVDRIAAVRMIRRTMKNIDGGVEIRMKLEDVTMNGVKRKMKLEDGDMNVAKTKTMNDIERATNVTSGIGVRRTTPANEETTIAAIKSGIVAVEVEARLARMCLLPVAYCHSSPGCMLPVALKKLLHP
jgi:hypothetical protein